MLFIALKFKITVMFIVCILGNSEFPHEILSSADFIFFIFFFNLFYLSFCLFVFSQIDFFRKFILSKIHVPL